MAWLPHSEKISKISLFVLAQLTNVTDRQTDGQTDRHRVTTIAALCIASHGKNCAVSMLKLTTDKHEASRGVSATAEFLVYCPVQSCPVLVILFFSQLRPGRTPGRILTFMG